MAAGLPLLPASLCTLLFGAVVLDGARDRFAERGAQPVVVVDRIEPALLSPTRPLSLHGFAPEKDRAPLVLIATRSDAPRDAYDSLARHLASHGFAALVLARTPDESWVRYADALALAAHQLPFEAETPEHPWSRILRTRGLAIVADGDAEAPAARAAAAVPGVRALVLLDGDDAGTALPWLDRAKAAFLYVGASEGNAMALPGLPSFNASGAERRQRWHVRLRTAGPVIARADEHLEGGAARPVVRDVEALVARFLVAQVAPRRDPTSLRDLARLGVVERDVRSGLAPPPRPVAKKQR